MAFPDVTVSPPIPAGRRLCPECHGRGVVGRRNENGDPQTEESWDCPTCDPHDGRASLGHVHPRSDAWANR